VSTTNVENKVLLLFSENATFVLTSQDAETPSHYGLNLGLGQVFFSQNLLLLLVFAKICDENTKLSRKFSQKLFFYDQTISKDTVVQHKGFLGYFSAGAFIS
jgi:hypothetical protein